MSADNGIYIGCFPLASVPDKYEYRVIEAAAIENCEDSDSWSKEATDHYRVVYFNSPKAKVFQNLQEARNFAFELSREFDILEYGISELEFDRPLINSTYKESDDWLTDFWLVKPWSGE